MTENMRTVGFRCVEDHCRSTPNGQRPRRHAARRDRGSRWVPRWGEQPARCMWACSDESNCDSQPVASEQSVRNRCEFGVSVLFDEVLGEKKEQVNHAAEATMPINLLGNSNAFEQPFLLCSFLANRFAEHSERKAANLPQSNGHRCNIMHGHGEMALCCRTRWPFAQA